jgi:hypothetical protein
MYSRLSGFHLARKTYRLSIFLDFYHVQLFLISNCEFSQLYLQIFFFHSISHVKSHKIDISESPQLEKQKWRFCQIFGASTISKLVIMNFLR